MSQKEKKGEPKSAAVMASEVYNRAMLSETLVKRLKDDIDFGEFMNYVAEQVEALDTVEGLEQMTNEQAGEEAKVRNKAKAVLLQILRPFWEFAEKKEPSEAEKAQAGKKYGL